MEELLKIVHFILKIVTMSGEGLVRSGGGLRHSSVVGLGDAPEVLPEALQEDGLLAVDGELVPVPIPMVRHTGWCGA